MADGVGSDQHAIPSLLRNRPMSPLHQHVPVVRRSPGRSFVLIALSAALIAVVGLAAYTWSARMGSPLFLLRYALTPDSRVETLFSTRTAAASPQPRPIPEQFRPLPQTVPWEGQPLATVSMLERTRTNAFLALCNGALVHAWYASADDRTRRHSSWSVAKSVVSLLIGQQIEEGRLSEDDRLVDVLPEYVTGTAFDGITVRDLLDMKSGMDVPENYAWYTPFSGVGGLQMSVDLPHYLMRNRTLLFTPGSRADYRSVDTQYLSMIVARIDQQSLTAVLERRLWQPMGAQDAATWNLDHADGIEKGFGNLNATARDFAKIGLLMLPGNDRHARSLVSEAWRRRIQTPVGEAAKHWLYAAQWWHPPGHEAHGDFTAQGVYGQYIHVSPKHNAVIVKLSDHGAEQDEEALIAVFRAVAKGCDG